MSKVVVIGAGVSGLAIASRLANSGYDVEVYEKNSFAGGKASALSIGKYIWDIHPDQIIDYRELKKLFKSCRSDIKKYLKIKNSRQSIEYIFENGETALDILSQEKLAGSLHDNFSEPKRHTTEYFRDSKKVYETIIKNYLFSSAEGTLYNKNNLSNLSGSPLQLLTRSLNTEIKRRFARPQSQRIIEYRTNFCGSNPKKILAISIYQEYIYKISNKSTINGGFHQLIKALCKLAADKGVKIYYESEVTKITHDSSKVTGIITENGWKKADFVVSAVDVRQLYGTLLPITKGVKKYVLADSSQSQVVFCWGVGKKLNKLNEKTVFFSKDSKSENKFLWRNSKNYNDLTFSAEVQSKLHRGYSPAGSESLLVRLNVPAGKLETEWLVETRKVVIERLSKFLSFNLEDVIEYETILTPEDFEDQFGLKDGSLYGQATHGLSGIFIRHPNTNPDYDRMYYVGETVRPGSGLTMALQSSEIVALKIKSKKL